MFTHSFMIKRFMCPVTSWWVPLFVCLSCNYVHPIIVYKGAGMLIALGMKLAFRWSFWCSKACSALASWSIDQCCAWSQSVSSEQATWSKLWCYRWRLLFCVQCPLPCAQFKLPYCGMAHSGLGTACMKFCSVHVTTNSKRTLVQHVFSRS